MRNIKLIIVACLLTIISKSQPYGSTYYNRTSFNMSMGTICTATSGLLMVSYVPSSLSLPNFGIDRTDIGGAVNTAAGFEFHQSYSVVLGSTSCNAGTVQVSNCAGVSVIETVLSSPTRSYALAGATTRGVFFATLFFGGGIATQALYRFPTGAFSPTKPLIVESTAGQEYFICGSYSVATAGAFMYALKVAPNGNVIQSRTYKVASGTELFPSDMIISPYSPGGIDELVVIGRADNTIVDPTGTDNKPFFMRLKQSDLTNVSCSVYGRLTTFAYPNDWFSAIAVASSTTNGGDGFVVAGHSDSASKHPVWIEKLDRIGNPLWSQVYRPVNDDSPSVTAVDVIERHSAAGNYEYFAAMTSSVGMVVLKLDANGTIFTSTPPINNVSEFLYIHNATTPPSQAVSLSYLDNGGSNDQGIHVFGTYANTGLTYFVEAPFNGYITDPVGCNGSTTSTIVAQLNGPPRSGTVGITTTSGLSACANITITAANFTITPTSTCVNASLPNGGSLQRTLTTGITANTIGTEKLNIYPNPATKNIFVELNAEQTTHLEIDLFDVTGRFISKLTTPETFKNGTQSFEVNLEKLALKSGVYFLNIHLNDSYQKQKLIYTKE